VLAATAALPLLMTGCKAIAVLGAVPKPPRDVLLLRAAISAEQLMVARYEAGIRVLDGGQGDLAAALRELVTSIYRRRNFTPERVAAEIDGRFAPADVTAFGLPILTRRGLREYGEIVIRAFLDQPRDAEQVAGAAGRRDVRPRFEGPSRGLDRAVDVDGVGF